MPLKVTAAVLPVAGSMMPPVCVPGSVGVIGVCPPTVTLQIAVLLPSAVMTEICVVPSFTPVTTPLCETVAMLGVEDSQVTCLFVASAGSTVALRTSEPPTPRFRLLLFSVTPVTSFFASVTVTTQEAYLPLSSAAFATMVAFPAFLAVTTPSLETAATPASEDSQVTSLFVALDGESIACSVKFCPVVRLSVLLFSVMPLTATFGISTSVCTSISRISLSSHSLMPAPLVYRSMVVVLPLILKVTSAAGASTSPPGLDE